MVTARARVLQIGAMGTLQGMLEPLAAYPRWLVAACLVLAAVAVGWLLARLLKWAVVLTVTVAVLAAVVLAVVWIWG